MPHTGLCGCWGGRVLPLLLAYVCYLLLGATVFQLLEKQAEAQSRDQFQFAKLRFLENYTCLDQRALEQFVQVIMEAWVKGVNPKGNSTNPSNWDFGSSFFFAGTVVTTIGYGNLAPSTEAGQVFCVFYALVGIPLNVVFLNHLGTGLRGHLTTLERWEDQPRRSQLLQTLGLALFLTLGTLVILVFPPMVFSHVEGWSFGEGFYFAFITLSTIGFGDYVVGHPLTPSPTLGPCLLRSVSKHVSLGKRRVSKSQETSKDKVPGGSADPWEKALLSRPFCQTAAPLERLRQYTRPRAGSPRTATWAPASLRSSAARRARKCPGTSGQA
uniref:2P domain potassium channel Talk-1 n=1 Tax=Molossus molossus TaxID=27622 RepID=A0A7J8GPN3_MOLMO|nr:potassium two pore domain channel subfamily K member 16 [Molossus molossus]